MFIHDTTQSPAGWARLADRTIRPEWQRAAARDRLGIAPIEVDAGHDPHVSQPELLATVLASLDG